MSPIKREYIFYLEDMLQSMERIEEYLVEIDFDKFSKTHIVIDATVRNFEIIGEAAKSVPINIQEKYPEIPWKKIYGLRNLISYEYFGIDYEMIWKIAKTNLPQNQIDLEKIVKRENGDLGKK
jgi:uncharacterized protein with HEPN domain|tara:strand:- start:223 stop:591 length:369 start_codon:yes stop_codon:yes gene_type:complete